MPLISSRESIAAGLPRVTVVVSCVRRVGVAREKRKSSTRSKRKRRSRNKNRNEKKRYITEYNREEAEIETGEIEEKEQNITEKKHE